MKFIYNGANFIIAVVVEEEVILEAEAVVPVPMVLVETTETAAAVLDIFQDL